jgi:hypothetical protein
VTYTPKEPEPVVVPLPTPVPEPSKPEVEAPKEPERPPVDKDEAKRILDDLLNNGFATYPCTIGRIRFMLRSRFNWEDTMIIRRMDKANPNLIITHQQEMSRLLLAGSLMGSGPTVFRPINAGTQAELEADFEVRLEEVDSLNNVFISVLTKELQKFDNIQSYITDNLEHLIKDF